jgi:hypothetical protein
VRFLADESCDFAVVRALRAERHDVAAIAEIARTAEDGEVRTPRPAPHCLPATSAKEQTMRQKSEFPAGWSEQRVRDLLAHYEGQSEEEAIAEDEAEFEQRTSSMVEVPIALLQAVRELIGKH